MLLSKTLVKYYFHTLSALQDLSTYYRSRHEKLKAVNWWPSNGYICVCACVVLRLEIWVLLDLPGYICFPVFSCPYKLFPFVILYINILIYNWIFHC